VPRNDATNSKNCEYDISKKSPYSQFQSQKPQFQVEECKYCKKRGHEEKIQNQGVKNTN